MSWIALSLLSLAAERQAFGPHGSANDLFLTHIKTPVCCVLEPMALAFKGLAYGFLKRKVDGNVAFRAVFKAWNPAFTGLPKVKGQYSRSYR